MPYELRSDSEVLRFLLEDPQRNAHLIRSLHREMRRGFSLIVDDPLRVRAVILVNRPDWRWSAGQPMLLQVEARDPGAAVALLAWLPKGGRYRFQVFRSELSRLVQNLVVPEVVEERSHFEVTRDSFHPHRLQAMMRELVAEEPDLYRQGRELAGARTGARLFGVVREQVLLSVAALVFDDSSGATIHGLWTREGARGRGYGTAVLSFATAEGLATAECASCSLPAADRQLLHMLSGLGYVPACPEWVVEGTLL